MQRSSYIKELEKRLNEKRKFIQVLAGPRQVGKTTIIKQFLESNHFDYISESADGNAVNAEILIEQIWTSARLKLKTGSIQVLLIIDEIQKLLNWSEIVKKFWDEDTKNNQNIKVILSGSSRLLLEKGLTESLQGRFELIYIPHWSYAEMQEAFGVSLDEYIYFGGYPGPAELIKDELRWKHYIKDSIIETSISKDILMLTSITKPALLRQLFDLGTIYSTRILPYNKMLGQLIDAGNTVTLAHYLNLLDQCGLLGGLQKYSGSIQHTRSSSPKLQVYNNALLSATQNKTFDICRKTPDVWGRFVESCVGTCLISNSYRLGYQVYYWREGNDEVDYVVSDNEQLYAIEVKSGSRNHNRGIEVIKQKYPKAKIYVVSNNVFTGSGIIPLEDFLKLSPLDLF
jgi:uncharacterized protein